MTMNQWLFVVCVGSLAFHLAAIVVLNLSNLLDHMARRAVGRNTTLYKGLKCRPSVREPCPVCDAGIGDDCEHVYERLAAPPSSASLHVDRENTPEETASLAELEHALRGTPVTPYDRLVKELRRMPTQARVDIARALDQVEGEQPRWETAPGSFGVLCSSCGLVTTMPAGSPDLPPICPACVAAGGDVDPGYERD